MKKPPEMPPELEIEFAPGAKSQMAIVSQIERNQREHVEAMLRAEWKLEDAAFRRAIYQRRMREAQS